MRWASIVVLAAAIVAVSARALAEPRTSSLSWLRMEGAESCVPTQALARAVEDRLGRSVFVSASKADVSVEGRIEPRDPGGFRAVLTVRDARGELLGTRELERPDADCGVMTDPLALVIALMIDPDAARPPEGSPDAARPSEAPSAPAPAPGDGGAPAAPAPPAGPPATPAERSTPAGPPAPPAERSTPAPTWRFEGGAAMTLAVGLAPEVAPGAGVESILYPPSFPVGFRGYGVVFLPTTAERDGARATFDMLLLGGALCPTLEGRVNLMACVGGQLGGLRPRVDTPGRGLSEDLLAVVDAALELRATMRIVAPVGASAGVGLLAPIARPTSRYDTTAGGRATLHRASAVAFTASAGLGIVLP